MSASAPPRVFVSVAEQSADLHAAKLLRAVHARRPEVQFFGVAGPQMRDAGCRAVFDMTAHAAMLSGAFRVIPQALAMLRTCKQVLRDERPQLAIVIDSPALNLAVAKHARRAGVPVLYYIAPQLWAWGEHRVRRIRACVNRLAVILPFEEAFFRGHGLDAEFVGHPLFDTLTHRSLDTVRIAHLRAEGTPVVAILPGSRSHVVNEVLPGQLEVAAAIRNQHPHVHLCVSVANERVRPLIANLLAASKLPHSLHAGENGEVLSAADFALVASGTATLEVAYYRTPMVVMYNATRLGYHLIGRWLINTRYFSLVNILAQREVVPEFMPFYKSTAPIIARTLGLLGDPAALARMRDDLESTIRPLVKTGASETAARVVLEMLDGATPAGRRE